jgi:hypothetical protein
MLPSSIRTVRKDHKRRKDRGYFTEGNEGNEGVFGLGAALRELAKTGTAHTRNRGRHCGAESGRLYSVGFPLGSPQPVLTEFKRITPRL